MKTTVHQSLEAEYESIQPFSCPRASKSLPRLTEDRAEDFNLKLPDFDDLSDLSDLVSSLEYLPYYRTCEEIFITPIAMHTSKEGADLEKRDGFGGYKVNIIQDETLNDLVNSMGYFPHYRTYEEHFCNLVLSDVFNVTAEEKENHTESQGKQGEGCAVTFRCADRSLPQSCETETAAIPSVTAAIPSVASVETFDPPLLTDGISENCASEITFLNGLSILNPPFSSTGYFPYYRSEEEQLISPSPWDGSSTAREALEDVSAQSTGRRTSWDFRMRCALS